MISIKEALAIQRNYFSAYGREISIRNLKLMMTVCWVIPVIYIIYLVVTVLFFPNRMISPEYGIIVPCFVVVFFRIKTVLKEDSISIREVRGLTILIYVAVLCYAIVLSVLPHPDLNAVYYPLALMLMPVMFILPVWQQIITNSLSYVIFFIGVILYKVPSCWMHDLFESFTALVFSMVTIMLMTQFRIQSEDLKDKYYQLSRKDGLTGVLNKVAGTMIIQEYVENIAFDETFSVIFLDIDAFKAINDGYGHAKGDEVLVGFGQILKNVFKSNTICRFGGDEFIILQKNTQREATVRTLEDLKKSLGKLSIAQHLTVECSVGVYSGRCGEKEYQTILELVDQTLYHVKTENKGTYMFYEE